MEKLIVVGKNRLYGDVYISGAKNAALPILAATILSEGSYQISNIPLLNDIKTMNKLLFALGITHTLEGNTLHLTNNGDDKLIEVPYDLVKTMRASILLLGPILAKKGEARVSLPGGCAIGERPVDLHISALEKMGATITVEDGYIHAVCKKLRGCTIDFEKVTVTGTENILMAATLAEGRTILNNAATEPEIEDLANLLIKMGAAIDGAGTPCIVIDGVSSLRSVDYEVMPDRIECGTFLAAVTATGGKIKVHNAPISSMTSILNALEEAGLELDIEDDNTLTATSSGYVKSVDIETSVYPGFPTDMQAQFMAAMLKADGVSSVAENIFENRFMHVAEYKRMGADIAVDGDTATVKGVKHFTGAQIMASDLRASAGLVIAGLIADSESEISRIYHLDRGYETFEKKLSNLGADIKRVKSEGQ